jgi:hypothetical protein
MMANMKGAGIDPGRPSTPFLISHLPSRPHFGLMEKDYQQARVPQRRDRPSPDVEY